MTASLHAKPSGTQGALQINGVDVIVFGAQGLESGLAPAVVSASKLSGNQSGSAPVYGLRAWCVFNGTLTGTNAPQAGGNVASVQRTAVGTYVITFAEAMPDTNYAVVGGGVGESASGLVRQGPGYRLTDKTTSQVTVLTGQDNTTLLDWVEASIHIVR